MPAIIGLMTEVSRKVEHTDVRVFRRKAIQNLSAPVSAPVVHKEEGIVPAALP